MKLYEVGEESKITVELLEANIEESQILKRDKARKCIIIDLKNPELDGKRVTISFPNKSKIQIWKNLVLKAFKPGSGLYVVSADVDSESINRRNSYRLDILKPATIILREKDKKENSFIFVTLKDLSSTGFCFFVKEKLSDSLRNSELKKLDFEDGKFDFDCSFVIKREIEIEGIYFYGCEFENLSNTYPLDKYLSEEQRKVLKEAKRNRL